MPPKWKKPTAERKAQLMAELRKDKADKESGYRAKALKLFPHICGRCAREFEGKRLRELTVHHKDHDHNNNPPDGKNWELLCLYCHDHEHEKTMAGRATKVSSGPTQPPPSTFSPFEDLDNLISPDKDK
jgi:hypothetical protein